MKSGKNTGAGGAPGRKRETRDVSMGKGGARGAKHSSAAVPAAPAAGVQGFTRPRPRKADRAWIDTAEFTRAGGSLSAVQPADDLQRLCELLADRGGEVAWALSGERASRAEGGFDRYLRLRLRGEVAMPCIRCLKPVRVQIDERRLFKLAVTETQAAREDAEAEDFDVLADDQRFDVLELVEDESIMALPIAPRHDDCTLPAQAGKTAAGGDAGSDESDDGEAPGDEARPNPFAVLSQLKRGRRRDPDNG